MQQHQQPLSVSPPWLNETADAIMERNGVQLTDCITRAEKGEAMMLLNASALEAADAAVAGLRRAILERMSAGRRTHHAREVDTRERELYAEVLARAAVTGAVTAFLRTNNHANNNKGLNTDNNNNINITSSTNNNSDMDARNGHNGEGSPGAQRPDDILALGLLHVFEAFQEVHSLPRSHYPPPRRGGSTVGTVGWDTLLLLHLVHIIPQAARRAGGDVIDDATGQMVRSWRKLLLSLQSADPNNAPEHSRRRGALAVCNGLLSILFHRYNTHQCRILINAVAQSERVAETSGDWGKSILRPAQHMTAEVVSYCYYKGRIALYDRRFDEAHAALREAYLQLPPPGSGTELQQRNKQRVRFFLTVAGVADGRVVPEEIQRIDDLITYVFSPIVAAIQRGDPNAFAEALEAFSSMLRRRGVYFLLLRAKQFCFLALLARTHAALAACGADNSRVPIHTLTAAYAHVVEEGKKNAAETGGVQRKQKRSRTDDEDAETGMTVTDDEMTWWIAKLIASGLVRGYISYEHKTIVLSRKEPFPTLQASV